MPAEGSPATARHYSLTHLRDHVLRQELSACARRERVATADLLARIAEFDARRLYSEAACSSMLDYSMRKLHMSEDSSLRRIRVGRTARAFPAIFPMLADGRLSLTAVLLLTPMLTEANAAELLAAAEHRSKSEIEMLLAMRFPQLPSTTRADLFPSSGNKVALEPPVPSDTRAGGDSAGPLSDARVEGKSESSAGIASPRFAFVVSEDDVAVTDEATGNVLGASTAAEDLATAPSAPVQDSDRVRAMTWIEATNSADLVATAPAAHGLPCYLRFTPVSAERASLKGMLSLEAMHQFKRLQDLVGKPGASADAAELLEKAIKAYADAIEKKKFGTGVRTRPAQADTNRRHSALAGNSVPNDRQVARARKEAPNSRHAAHPGKLAPNSRHLPAAIRRAVHERDGGRCTFVSPEGERCTCRASLQFDHVKPLGCGGETTAANLRLLCGAHNQLEARRVYGEPFVRGKREQARARSEPGVPRDRKRRGEAA